MPNCNRHFFLLDTVEFRLDLSYRHQFLSEVMKLIEDTFPQMFHYVKLRCVSVEAHAVSVKCFAPCDLRLALLKQRDMANFLRSRQNVLSIIVGGVEIAEQASAKEGYLQAQRIEELNREINILHHDLDKEKRKNEGRDCNAEFVNKLSCDLKEKTDQLDVTRQMLRGTQMELEDVKQRETKLKTELENVKQLHSQQQAKNAPKKRSGTGFFKRFRKAETPRDDTRQSVSEITVPDVKDSVETFSRSLSYRKDHQPLATDIDVLKPIDQSSVTENPSQPVDSINPEPKHLVDMKTPIPVNTDSEKSGNRSSIHYSYPVHQAYGTHNDAYYKQPKE